MRKRSWPEDRLAEGESPGKHSSQQLLCVGINRAHGRILHLLPVRAKKIGTEEHQGRDGKEDRGDDLLHPQHNEGLSRSQGSALPTVVFQNVANTTSSEIEAELSDFHV